MKYSAINLAILCLLCVGCTKSPDPAGDPRSSGTAPQASQSADWAPEPLRKPHLSNAYRIHEKVMSGGAPEGAEAFQELEQLGVKTIISVDGAMPDVELAAKYGIRYVHILFGYDGVPEEQGRELAKAVRDLLLREHFTELLRTDDVGGYPEECREVLRDGESAARELECGLRDFTQATDHAPSVIAESLERITNNCKNCHAEYRDNSRSRRR